MASLERLQKVIAKAGVASRRASEQLILDGRVRVDGVLVRELGTKVDPALAVIEVDGARISSQRQRYIMLNKPGGYVTTMSDERGRRTVADLVDVRQRVVPVGRLDRPTQGLLLFTNDGELANRVMHPRYRLAKEYAALVAGNPPPDVLERIREGITIDGVRCIPEEVRALRETADGLLLRVVVHEGRNRIVRRIFDAVNFPVMSLARTRIGPLHLGNLAKGAWRDLHPGEVDQLRDALGYSDRATSNTRGDPGSRRSGRKRS